LRHFPFVARVAKCARKTRKHREDKMMQRLAATRVVRWAGVFALGVGAGVLSAGVLFAQPAGFQRAMLLTAPIAANAEYEATIGTVTVPPGAASPKHSHPGDEIGVMLEGESVVEIDGAPPARFAAGQAFHIPAGKAHVARSVGTVPAKVVSIWIIEKGKPLQAIVK
jgi:quercetin dioxygenase-like cupin family protein